MRVGCIVVGLVLVASAMALSAVARYDGVLGATAPDEILSPGGSRQVTMRVNVIGTPEDTDARFADYRLGLLVPPGMDLSMREAHYVPVQFADDPALTVFLAYEGASPAVGSLLVVKAQVRTHWPIEPERVGPVEPVIFLDDVDFHAPLFFK